MCFYLQLLAIQANLPCGLQSYENSHAMSFIRIIGLFHLSIIFVQQVAKVFISSLTTKANFTMKILIKLSNHLVKEVV